MELFDVFLQFYNSKLIPFTTASRTEVKLLFRRNNITKIIPLSLSLSIHPSSYLSLSCDNCVTFTHTYHSLQGHIYDNQTTTHYITAKTNLQSIHVLFKFTAFCHTQLQISDTFIYLLSLSL